MPSDARYPATSSNRCAWPAEENNVTAPFVPSFMITAFATVRPAGAFTVDTPGRGVPAGYTTAYVPAVGVATVSVPTTAATPLPGMPARPVSTEVTLVPPVTTPLRTPTPLRVSTIRCGVTLRNWPPVTK